MSRALRRALLVSLAFIVVAVAGRARAATADGPLGKVRRTNDRIMGLLRKQARSPAGAKPIDRELTRVVAQFLDFPELARLALGRHWEARSATERQEFSELLRQLIERSYLKQLRSNLNYTVRYLGEKIVGDQAEISTSIEVKRKGRSEALVIQYKMRRGTGGWMVYDVITDDVSVVRNYRSQFNRIIQRQSYNALLEKLRRKLKDPA
ncbi:MAG: ABC transporter substrate-binding protein [Proteobacteria bacterium]|nr:ABC transporter substrate-binding protein [Pseudomonadota bacterium]